MNEFVEKIVEKLEELRQIEYDREDYIDEDGLYNDCEEAFADGESNGRYQAYVRIMKFIIEIEKEYNNGWIPCSERLPADKTDVLVWHSDQDMHCVAWYNSASKIWYSNDFEIADSKYIVAWQPLPKPYE